MKTSAICKAYYAISVLEFLAACTFMIFCIFRHWYKVRILLYMVLVMVVICAMLWRFIHVRAPKFISERYAQERNAVFLHQGSVPKWPLFVRYSIWVVLILTPLISLFLDNL